MGGKRRVLSFEVMERRIVLMLLYK